MGDMYGGKIIAKKVPGSGKCYGFEDRPALIKALDAKLSTDIVDEALVAFDLAIEFFNELQEKLNDRGSSNGS
jgi:heme oxygenase